MTAKIDAAKRAAARLAVQEHWPAAAGFVGIGSGSTVVFVVEAIKNLGISSQELDRIQFVPTGSQSRQLIVDAGLRALSYDELPPTQMLDVAFDGADEVDAELNCIKGGGACLYQEKLVAMRARKFICVAAIPIEVHPFARAHVLAELERLGSVKSEVREATQSTKEQKHLRTDQNNLIVDAAFGRPLALGPGEKGCKVDGLAKQIKAIEGVLSVGLFTGTNGFQRDRDAVLGGGQKPIAAYFGMEDGRIVVREASEAERSAKERTIEASAA